MSGALAGQGADVRRRAAHALDRILATAAPADSYLATAEDGLDGRDRRLLRELVLGTLRWLRRVDHVLEAASGRQRKRIRPRLLSPLRLGAYQLLFLDRVPGFAAVDQAVSEARRRGGRAGAGFVNAVLRKVAARPRVEAWPVSAGDEAARLGIETSHPDFLVRRWLARFGAEETRRLLEASNRQRPVWLLALGDRAALSRELRREGVETVDSELVSTALRVVSGDPFRTGSFVRGAFYAQDEGSQAAALVPPPQPGELVLDAAAAPGGKGFALATAESAVAIRSGDRSLPRLLRLRQNQRRLGRVAPIAVFDSVWPPFGAVFDRVIADLSCSGTGTLARHPELKWRLSPQEIDRLGNEAFQVMAALAGAVKPGGLLLLVTCSIEPEENEDVVERLLERRSDLAPVSLEDQLRPASANHVFAPGGWRLLPASQRDGFTVHVLRSSARA